MQSLNEFIKNTSNIKTFIFKLFEVRQQAHKVHLQSKSFAEHSALDGFYNGLLELIDEFIETYQGEYGIISEYPNIEIKDINIISYLEDFTNILKSAHTLIKEEDSHLDNLVDEMTALTYRTLYKLKNLK